jgi:hypothetical protein
LILPWSSRRKTESCVTGREPILGAPLGIVFVGAARRPGLGRSLEISVEHLAEAGPVTPGSQTRPKENRAKQQQRESGDLAIAQDSGTKGAARRIGDAA